MVVSNISDAEPLLPPPSSCSLGCSFKHDENANRVRKEMTQVNKCEIYRLIILSHEV